MIKEAITVKLYKTMRSGVRSLSDEAAKRIAEFVESQFTDNYACINRGGQADLYYTSFGWMLAASLGIPTSRMKTSAYLSHIKTDSLDLVHYAAYIRCKALRRLMMHGDMMLLIPSFVYLGDDEFRVSYRAMPHNDARAPYSQFIRYSLIEDAKRYIRSKKKTVENLEMYRTPTGGFKNTLDGKFATTNATVAALAVKGQIEGYGGDNGLTFLLDQQDTSGGFRASETSPIPDLLSTATALYTLRNYNVEPRYNARDFVDAHWLASGGFAATQADLDAPSDTEYTFYGLLALGCLKD